MENYAIYFYKNLCTLNIYKQIQKKKGKLYTTIRCITQTLHFSRQSNSVYIFSKYIVILLILGPAQ